jgi:hypothetical protein
MLAESKAQRFFCSKTFCQPLRKSKVFARMKKPPHSRQKKARAKRLRLENRSGQPEISVAGVRGVD